MSIEQFLIDKFNSSYTIEPNTGCWLWTGLGTKRYGQFTYKRITYYGHRLSYEIHKGPIPVGKLVCQKCKQSFCVNPDHLYLGTWNDTHAGTNNVNHVLTEEQVLDIRRRLSEGTQQKTLAKEYDVSTSIIYGIKTRRSWKHI